MIIDTHTHFYDPHRPAGVPWPPPENKLLYRTVLPRHFEEIAAPHGVHKTIVVEASPWPTDNQWIVALMADSPALVGLVGHIDPNAPDFAITLAQWMAHPKFCGIRCHAAHFNDVEAGAFLQGMTALAQAGGALDALVRKEQFSGLIAVAKHLPTLPIVVNHIGHMPIDGAAVSNEWVEYYQALAAQPNIQMKVSAVIEQSVIQPAPTALDYYRPTLDLLWESFGADRLIYGSNWPVVERAGTYATAFQLVHEYFSEKGNQAYANYFWENAQRVYGCG